MTLGNRIENQRQKNALSQKDLSTKMGVSTGTIAEWESDEIIPSLSEIITLSQIFNITTDQLIKDTDTLDENQDISNPSTLQSNKSKKPNKPRHIKRIVGIIVIVSIILLGVAVFLSRDYIPVLFPSPTPTPEEIYNMVAPSTVEIFAASLEHTSIGTGFFIDDEGTVITNYHVIENCFDAKVITYDGTEWEVMSVLGYDKDLDVAILRSGCTKSTALPYREDTVITGEKAYTLGSSLGLTGTFAEGIISTATRKINGQNFIQTTAPISSGNSGGPLIDKTGKVIGITTAGFDEGQNLNLAVPIVLAINIDRDIHKTMIEIFLDKYDFTDNPYEGLRCKYFLSLDAPEEIIYEMLEILARTPLK